VEYDINKTLLVSINLRGVLPKWGWCGIHGNKLMLMGGLCRSKKIIFMPKSHKYWVSEKHFFDPHSPQYALYIWEDKI
jgi:hypothetical protein